MVKDNFIKVDWNVMNQELNALADSIGEILKVTKEIKPFVKLGKFVIGIPIEKMNPSFTAIALKAAEKVGIGVADDKSGVLIEVRGKDWEKMIKTVRNKILFWANETHIAKQKLTQKLEATPIKA